MTLLLRTTLSTVLVVSLSACFSSDKADDDDDDDGTTYTVVPGDDTGDGDGGASGGDTGEGGSGGDTGDGGSGGDTHITCSWTAGQFQIDITDGDPAGYSLGWAETDASCGEYCWTGEDCGYVGYTAGDGTVYDYCHDVGATGGNLVIVESVADVVPGLTTVMDPTWSPGITYYLHEQGTGTCWTWGHDNTYFFDCVDVSDDLSCSGD